MKQPYDSPRIETVGSVSELTMGNATGSRLDADFAAGTQFGDLTFS